MTFFWLWSLGHSDVHLCAKPWRFEKSGVWNKRGGRADWLLRNFTDFQVYIFVTSCLVFHNRDGWPSFKFHMHQDKRHIYLEVSNVKCIYVECFFKHATTAQNSDRFQWPLYRFQSTKAYNPWHHLTNTKYDCFHVKFEARYVICLARKSMPNKKRLFSWGIIHRFSEKRCLKKSATFQTWRMTWSLYR